MGGLEAISETSNERISTLYWQAVFKDEEIAARVAWDENVEESIKMAEQRVSVMSATIAYHGSQLCPS